MIRTSAVALATLLASTSLTSVSMAQTPASSPAPASGGFATSDATDPYPVSYTHLTLPTILLV